jgi:hypothetical protein
MNIIGGISEGFHNVPRLYGSDVRSSRPVEGIGSGFREGAKVNYGRSSVYSHLQG